MSSPGERIVILADPEAAHWKLAKEVLADHRAQARLLCVSSAEQLLDYLNRGDSQGESAPQPHLLLLNLDVAANRNVLHAVKTDARLRYIPVLLLEPSPSTDDVIEAYRTGANGFVSGPLTREVLLRILGFWLDVAQLPHEFDPGPP